MRLLAGEDHRAVPVPRVQAGAHVTVDAEERAVVGGGVGRGARVGDLVEGLGGVGSGGERLAQGLGVAHRVEVQARLEGLHLGGKAHGAHGERVEAHEQLGEHLVNHLVGLVVAAHALVVHVGVVEVALVEALVGVAHGRVDHSHAALRVAELVGARVGGGVHHHIELRVAGKHRVEHRAGVVEKLIRAGQPIVDLPCRVEHIVDVEHHEGLLGPLGVQLGDHLPRADGPVALAVGLAPLLGAVEHEAQRLGRLVAALHHGLRHGEGHAAPEGVVEVGVVVTVHVRAHEDELVALAGDVAPDVGALAAQGDDGARVERHRCLPVALGDGLQHGRVAVAADGQRRRLVRAAGVLGAHGVVVVLAKAAHVAGDDGAGAQQVRLVGRVVDPPVVVLVDGDEHELARHIEALQVGRRAAPAVHDLQLLHVAVQRGGEAAQGDEVVLPLGAGQVEAGLLEGPVVAGEGFFRYVNKADLLHLRGHEVDDLRLGGRPGAAVAHVGVVAERRDGIGHALGKRRVDAGEHARIRVLGLLLRQGKARRQRGDSSGERGAGSGLDERPSVHGVRPPLSRMTNARTARAGGTRLYGRQVSNGNPARGASGKIWGKSESRREGEVRAGRREGASRAWTGRRDGNGPRPGRGRGGHRRSSAGKRASSASFSCGPDPRGLAVGGTRPACRPGRSARSAPPPRRAP